MGKMRGQIFLLLIFFFVGGARATVLATGLYDEAGIFTAGQKSRLRELIVETARKNEAILVVETVKQPAALAGLEFQEQARRFSKWGEDRVRGLADASIYLIVSQTPELALLFVGKSMAGNFKPHRRDEALRTLGIHLGKNDFEGALQNFLSDVDAAIAVGTALPVIGGFPEEMPGRRSVARARIAWWLGLGMVTVAMVLLVLLIGEGRRAPKFSQQP